MFPRAQTPPPFTAEIAAPAVAIPLVPAMPHSSSATSDHINPPTSTALSNITSRSHSRHAVPLSALPAHTRHLSIPPATAAFSLSRIHTTTTTVTETLAAKIELNAPEIAVGKRDIKMYPLAKFNPPGSFKRFAVDMTISSGESVTGSRGSTSPKSTTVKVDFHDPRYDAPEQLDARDIELDAKRKGAARFQSNMDTVQTPVADRRFVTAHSKVSHPQLQATPISIQPCRISAPHIVATTPDTSILFPAAVTAPSLATTPTPMATSFSSSAIMRHSFGIDAPPPSPPAQSVFEEESDSEATSTRLESDDAIMLEDLPQRTRPSAHVVATPMVSFLPNTRVNGHDAAYLPPADTFRAYDSAPDEVKAWMLMEMMKRTPRAALTYTLSAVIPNIRVDFIRDVPASSVRERILRHLDIKSLMRAACVSPEWNTLIVGPSATKEESKSVAAIWRARLVQDGYCTFNDLHAAHAKNSEERHAIELATITPSAFGLGRCAPRDDMTVEDMASDSTSSSGTYASVSSSPSEQILSSTQELTGIMAPLMDQDSSPASITPPAQIVRPRPPLPSEFPKRHCIPLVSPERPLDCKKLYEHLRNIEVAWRKGKCTRLTFPGHNSSVVTTLAFSGNRIVSGSDDNTACIYDATTGALSRKLVGHEGGVWALAVYGDCIVTGGTDRTVRIWDAESGLCRKVLHGHSSTVRCCKIILPRSVSGGTKMEPAYPLLVTGSRDFTLRVWKLPLPGEENLTLPEGIAPVDTNNPEDALLRHVLSGHQGSVRSVDAWGRYMISGSYDHTAKVWDVITGQLLHTLEGHVNKVYSVGIDNQAKFCATGSMDGSVRIWNIQSGVCEHMFEGHSSLVGLLDLSPTQLVTAAADMRIRAWRLPNGEPRYVLRGHSGAITCFQQAFERIVSGSDGTLKLWDLRAGTFIRDLLSGLNGVWQVRFDRTRCVAAVQRRGTTWFEVLDFGAVINGDANAGHHTHVAYHDSEGYPQGVRQSMDELMDEDAPTPPLPVPPPVAATDENDGQHQPPLPQAAPQLAQILPAQPLAQALPIPTMAQAPPPMFAPLAAPQMFPLHFGNGAHQAMHHGGHFGHGSQYMGVQLAPPAPQPPAAQLQHGLATALNAPAHPQALNAPYGGPLTITQMIHQLQMNQHQQTQNVQQQQPQAFHQQLPAQHHQVPTHQQAPTLLQQVPTQNQHASAYHHQALLQPLQHTANLQQGQAQQSQLTIHHQTGGVTHFQPIPLNPPAPLFAPLFHHNPHVPHQPASGSVFVNEFAQQQTHGGLGAFTGQTNHANVFHAAGVNPFNGAPAVVFPQATLHQQPSAPVAQYSVAHQQQELAPPQQVMPAESEDVTENFDGEESDDGEMLGEDIDGLDDSWF